MKSKSIYISILILIIGCILSLPFVSVPISSSAPGIIRSQKENTKLVSVVNGRVIASKFENNNQIIKQGDTLIVITAEQLDTQKQLQSSQRSDYLAQLNDLSKLSNGQFYNLQTDQFQKELSSMKEKIAQVENQLSLAKKDYDRAKILYDQGVIPKSEYDKYYYDYHGLVPQISGIKEQQLALWQAQKRDVERNLRTLGAEVIRIDQEQKNYYIIAPISGRLVNFSGIVKGNFIIQGQNIGEISSDNFLVAECLVPPKDIGFIKLGQNVKFQIDTYNYNQWGLLNGKVKVIDQNLTVNQQTGEAYFRVLCSMDENFLQLKNGYKGKIGKGMTLTARFHLIDRTLWQLIFDRVDDWFNPNLL